MKKILLIAPVAIFTILASCNEAETKVENKVEEVAKVEIESKSYIVSATESTIEWLGEGVGHGHKGNLTIKEGKFIVENNTIAKGVLTIDMTSLTVTDIPVEDEDNAKLVGHLTTEDFFDVTNFPTASLVIIDGSDLNAVKAKLTIKDVTKEITFAVVLADENDKMNLTSTLKIDRTKFGIKYNSGNFFEDLGDYLIDDEFTLNISLVTE